MEKDNFKLFKQAINEGLSNKFDYISNSYSGEIACSDKHDLAMRAIVYGKTDAKRVWSPKMKRIVALLIAAALLLTSCSVIFYNEISEIIKDFFVSISFKEDPSADDQIKEVYTLEYIPIGYILTEEKIGQLRVTYVFTNESGNTIFFEQCIKNGAAFVFDSESGYSEFKKTEDITVYYKKTYTRHYYLWLDDNYSICVTSTNELSGEEIVKIINGITVK